MGGLIGSVSSSAVISYSFSTANVSADTIAGGLVGGSLDPGSTLTDTYARGRVAAQSVAGGLIGETHGLVSRSHARADVLGSESGGMVGRLSDNTASIEFSIANGNVVGQEKVGGLLGATSNNAVVRYSVATGHVQGTAQSGGLVGSSESGALAVSYSFSTGKVFSAASSKGALIGESAGAVLTRNLAYDHGHGLTCTEAGTHANCNLAITGTFTPDDLRFSPELEFVELKRQESVPIALRKISLSDQAAYRVWGRCKEHGQSVSITATGGGTVNAQAECTAFTWEQSLNLSALPDGPVEISVTDGTVTRVLYLTKETAYCNSPSRVGIHYANDGEAGINGLSVGNAFAICTPEQFQNIRNNPAGTYYFKLMNNLDFEAESSNPSSSFTFRLDGNGFLVRRAVVVAPTVNIGILRGFQTVANVGIEESHVTGDRDIGLVTQFLGGGALLSDAYASGTVLAMTYAGGSGAGGLVGSVHGGVVSGVASFADVTGFDVGGAFAIIGQGSAARSISQGNVIARRVGGGFACRIGNVFVTGSVVTQSAATGHVVGLSSGADEFGGFAASIIYNVPLVENNRASGSVLSPALNLGGFVAINSPFGTSFSVTLRNNLATGHVLGGNSTGNHSAFSGGLGSWIGGPTLLIQDAVALGHVQSPAVDLGAILGQSTNTDATGSTVTTSYFWAHPGMPIPCIDNNSNMTDPVTCNDVEIPSFYQNLSNFTSATSVYANWDFVNEWKFPAAGGTPLLRWE